jgi:hypothetical protein
MTNPVLNSIEYVIDNSQYVHFDDEAAKQFVEQHRSKAAKIPEWEDGYHFHDGTSKSLIYLLMLDTLNFCFWENGPRWKIEYNGQVLDGYVALAAKLRQGFESDPRLVDINYLAQIPLEDVGILLLGQGEIPLLEQRHQVLQEMGRVLISQFEGNVVNLIEQANHSAWKLVSLLVNYFPSFRDEADYDGHRVYLYKRAQIFCADVYGAFDGQAWGQFDDLDQLTAFADYKLPQLLRAHGILKYEQSLAKRVDAQEEISAGAKEEIEIRAYTIHAVEQLKRLFGEVNVHLNSIELDWLLWHWSQNIEAESYHRTRTIYY